MSGYSGDDEQLKKLFRESQLGDGWAAGQMAILACCTEIVAKRIKELELSTSKSASESANLAKKVLALNWVLAIATAVYTIVAILNFCRR